MRTRYVRPLAFSATLILGVATLVPADEPETFAVPPRLVKLDMPNSTLGKVVPVLNRHTGIPVTFPPAAAGETCDGVFNGKPFWAALELMADQTGNRIVLHDDGRGIALQPRGKSWEVSSVHGAFRVVARQTVGRFRLDDGVVSHEVHLDAHWEPRFPVFRIDSRPKVTTATDDRGAKLAAQPPSTLTQPTGAVHGSMVQLTGVTPGARKIAVLKGGYRVTASAKMLAFKFDNLTAKWPAALPVQEKVEAVLKGFTKDEATWEAEIELTYPPTLPEFESFEMSAWTTGNRLRLVTSGGKAHQPESHAVHAVGQKVVAKYYFKEDAAKGLANPTGKDWSLVYEAPSTPVEFTVPFELKDIPLP